MIAWLTNKPFGNVEMDNYRFYLSARVQCFKSFEQDFSPCSLFRCVIWFRCGPWRLHLLILCHPVLCLPSSSKCSVGSILLSVFVLVDPSPSLGRVWELKNPLCFSKCVLLIETRQRSSALVLLVENTNRTKSVFVLL